MQSRAKEISIKLSLSIIGMLLFVNPCYANNAPDASPDDPALVIQRALRSALESADEVILYSLDPDGPDSSSWRYALFPGILGDAIQPIRDPWSGAN